MHSAATAKEEVLWGVYTLHFPLISSMKNIQSLAALSNLSPSHPAVVDCGPLSSPDNGEVITTGTTFGFTASYLCDPGYVLIGFSQRVCQINGAWAGDEPFCRGEYCVRVLGYLDQTIVYQK